MGSERVEEPAPVQVSFLQALLPVELRPSLIDPVGLVDGRVKPGHDGGTIGVASQGNL